MSQKKLAIRGFFRLRFEFVDADTNTVRTERVFHEAEFTGVPDFPGLIAKSARELNDKLLRSLEEDGTIAAPSNVIHVDFKRRQRA
ncbi:hypothetical protein [Paraburkholderia kururiensis]|uniref:hypothetical protein n=1 Tax=Paraburkholderia kururiensis TaxID=984307 RepID=UPI0005A73ED3|nr:hypothetical protein [Paraburkholderia kururiensis]